MPKKLSAAALHSAEKIPLNFSVQCNTNKGRTCVINPAQEGLPMDTFVSIRMSEKQKSERDVA